MKTYQNSKATGLERLSNKGSATISAPEEVVAASRSVVKDILVLDLVLDGLLEVANVRVGTTLFFVQKIIIII